MPIFFTPKRKKYKNACFGVKCYFFYFVRFWRTFSLSVKSMGIPLYFSLNLKKYAKPGQTRKSRFFAKNKHFCIFRVSG